MSDVSQGPGWWKASDEKWYPPEQHPQYQSPPPPPNPLSDNQESIPQRDWAATQPVPLPPNPSEVSTGVPTRSGTEGRNFRNKKLLLAAVGTAVAVGVVVGVLVLALGSSGNGDRRTQRANTTLGASSAPDTEASQSISPSLVAQYQQDTAQYLSAWSSANTEVGSASADITKQKERYASDQTTYTSNEFGSGCTIGTDFDAYSSCLAQEQQTASGALQDENSAVAAEKADVQQEITADQQIQDALATYVQELDSLEWPPVAQEQAATYAQELTDYREAEAQIATDLANGVDITADSESLTTISSNVTTAGINLATVLGIPPPSSTSNG